MAPEQIEGGEVTPAADIYALGVVMFELLTGHLPFSDRSPLQTARKRLTEAPPTPRAFVPELDPKWEHFILRCLAREPAQRFPNALALRDAIPLPDEHGATHEDVWVPWTDPSPGGWEAEDAEAAPPPPDPRSLPWPQTPSEPHSPGPRDSIPSLFQPQPRGSGEERDTLALPDGPPPPRRSR
jgi:serine/threonine protein kinase